ncbi:MAG: hypothetical protein HKL91_04965 [Candidatus Eremiobacteraeota bacterium]|uniref:Uncharacterized protein n=1 Tax=mine drainage metagenome TaxID=410659 RepID=E6Q4C6_9ZZZZ|nr:hypothetical protein [Candidatus Eremiobacteraeota bacterium]
MRNTSLHRVLVEYGYAAAATGSAVLIARIRRGRSAQLLRVPFSIAVPEEWVERAAAYSALYALIQALRRFGRDLGTVVVPDPELLEDMREHRSLPAILHRPYIHLVCALRAMPSLELANGGAEDLSALARAELSRIAA